MVTRFATTALMRSWEWPSDRFAEIQFAERGFIAPRGVLQSAACSAPRSDRHHAPAMHPLSPRPPMKLAFSSNAYLHFSVEETIRRVAGLGYSGIEILADVPHAWPAGLLE